MRGALIRCGCVLVALVSGCASDVQNPHGPILFSETQALDDDVIAEAIEPSPTRAGSICASNPGFIGACEEGEQPESLYLQWDHPEAIRKIRELREAAQAGSVSAQQYPQVEIAAYHESDCRADGYCYPSPRTLPIRLSPQEIREGADGTQFVHLSQRAICESVTRREGRRAGPHRYMFGVTMVAPELVYFEVYWHWVQCISYTEHNV